MKTNWLIIFFILSCSACSSAKVKLSHGIKDGGFRSLAVLPVEYPADIPREKVDAIHDAVEAELKNSGFVVLADKIVRQTCSSPACPERDALASKYLVDGFATVNVGSVSRTNFVAGFYNAIKGKLRISDKTDKELVTIEHTQSERGGLLFNTGQIVQGLTSYANNTEQASFTKLASGLAQTLASKVPRTKDAALNSDAAAVNLGDVEFKQVRPGVFRVCTEAAPNMLVSVIINRQRSNLRPAGNARYCGSFLLDPPDMKDAVLKVEARSAFGNSVQKEISLSQYVKDCDLKNHVYLKQAKGKTAIQIACSGAAEAEADCKSKIASCGSHRFIVFKAPSNLDPFEKVAEVRGFSWIDSNAKPGSAQIYQLVSVSRDGVWSLPVAAKPDTQKG